MKYILLDEQYEDIENKLIQLDSIASMLITNICQDESNNKEIINNVIWAMQGIVNNTQETLHRAERV